MHIETKFNIGDKVIVCQNNGRYERETCRICKGNGHVVISGKRFQCPECHGVKHTDSKYIRNITPVQAEIVKVVTSTTINNGNVQLHVKYIIREHNKNHGKRDRSIAEYRNIIFYSLEEAEARCKELIEQEDS